MFYIVVFIIFLIVTLYIYIINKFIEIDFSIFKGINISEHIFSKEEFKKKKQYIKEQVRKDVKISRILLSDKKLDHLIEIYKQI